MRGESLEPGGCSLTPTSPRTAFTMACPAPVGAVCAAAPNAAAGAVPPSAAGGAVAPSVAGGAPAVSVAVAAGAPALCSAEAKLVVVAGAAAEGAAAGGVKVDWSCPIRARTASRDMHDQHRQGGVRALTQTGGPMGPPAAIRPSVGYVWRRALQQRRLLFLKPDRTNLRRGLKLVRIGGERPAGTPARPRGPRGIPCDRRSMSIECLGSRSGSLPPRPN